jgi:Mrp family chromosome partitioning ATPase/capsular polysaccharide biosynthesis protein
MHASSRASPPGRDEPGGDWGAPAGGSVATSLLQAVRSHPLLIVAVTLAAVLAGLAWSSLRTRTYEASAEVLVTPLPDTAIPDARLPLLRATADRTRIVQTAANLVDSNAAADATAARMGPGWTAQRVRAATNVQARGQSDVLAVTAQADDPREATRLADEFTRAALDARRAVLTPLVASLIAQTEDQLLAERNPRSQLAVDLDQRLADLRGLQGRGDPTLSISQLAEPPTAPVGPSRSLIVLLALLGGLLVGVGAALILDLLGPPRLADASRAVAATGLAVLARAPAPPRRWPGAAPGKRLRPGAAAAFRRLQREVELGHDVPCSVLLAGVTAGDGTTTCAADFALTLAASGHRVLLVDADPVPQLAARLGAQRPTPPAGALDSAEDSRARLADVPRVPGLKVLTFDEAGSAPASGAAASLRHVLDRATARFDYVIVDTAPLSESPDSLRLVSAVDAVVLVVRPGRTRVEDLETVTTLLERTAARLDGLLLVSGREWANAVRGPDHPAGTEPAARPVTERSR